MSHFCHFFQIKKSRLTLNGQFVTIPRVLSIEQRTAFNTAQHVEKEKNSSPLVS
jgi:hypothetical protein